ncbi:MAG: peptidase inhibitor family I36 protein [Nostoc sp.]
MKKLIIVFAVIVGISVSLIIPSWIRSNVVQAQTVPDCPVNSACIWSERNFAGNRTVFTALTTVSVGALGNLIESCRLTGTLNGIGRSVRNNSSCNLSISTTQRGLTGGFADAIISKNTRQGDTGDFRSAF